MLLGHQAFLPFIAGTGPKGLFVNWMNSNSCFWAQGLDMLWFWCMMMSYQSYATDSWRWSVLFRALSNKVTRPLFSDRSGTLAQSQKWRQAVHPKQHVPTQQLALRAPRGTRTDILNPYALPLMLLECDDTVSPHRSTARRSPNTPLRAHSGRVGHCITVTCVSRRPNRGHDVRCWV